MAVSNMNCGRKYKRYKIFFYTAGLIVIMQLYVGYSFYSMNQSEEVDFHQREKSKRNIETILNKSKINQPVGDITRITKVCCIYQYMFDNYFG